MTIDDLIARAVLEEVVLRYCTAVDKLGTSKNSWPIGA